MAKLHAHYSMATLASLMLVSIFSISSPAHAVIDCDANPTAPNCTGEPIPRPTPRPIPKPIPVPSSPIVQQVLARSSEIQQTIDTGWSEFGKGYQTTAIIRGSFAPRSVRDSYT